MLGWSQQLDVFHSIVVGALKNLANNPDLLLTELPISEFDCTLH